MPSHDHPAIRGLAEQVVEAAARYVDEAIDEQSTSTLAAHLDAEQQLVAAVRAWRAATLPAPRWDGPGIYRVTVSDRDGMTSGVIAAVDPEEIREAWLAQNPRPGALVDVTLVGPIPGADQ